MKRLISILAFLALVFAVLAGHAESKRTASVEKRTIVLLMAFPDPDEPAARDLETGFRFMAERGEAPFPFHVATAHSARDAALLCREFMLRDSVLMIVLASDEGAATAVALLAEELCFPVLKLTADHRSFTTLSSHVIEFLPSAEMQSRALGEFAAREQGYRVGLILAPREPLGRALADGFRGGFVSARGTVDNERYYAPSTSNVASDLAELFSNTARLTRGQSPLSTALTPEERTEMFGDPTAGEVVLTTDGRDTIPPPSAEGEAFFFALNSEKIHPFAGQLRALPKEARLFGNSAWTDREALSRHREATEGMIIAVPLLPDPVDTTEWLHNFEETLPGALSAWHILGVDAAEFVGRVVATSPRDREDALASMLQQNGFAGRAVTVDFRSGHENRAARILRFHDGELEVVK